MTKEKADACFESWKAHAKNGNSHKLIEHMDKFYDDLFGRYDDVQKKLTLKEQLKAERAEKMKLLQEHRVLENAVLELAQIVSNKVVEEQNGEVIPN